MARYDDALGSLEPKEQAKLTSLLTKLEAGPARLSRFPSTVRREHFLPLAHFKPVLQGIAAVVDGSLLLWNLRQALRGRWKEGGTVRCPRPRFIGNVVPLTEFLNLLRSHETITRLYPSDTELEFALRSLLTTGDGELLPLIRGIPAIPE